MASTHCQLFSLLAIEKQKSLTKSLFAKRGADDLSGEGPGVPPMKKLEDLIHLAELCVDLLQQNEEHYAEVSGWPCRVESGTFDRRHFHILALLGYETLGC